ncbi:MAG TPA: hypothetical protein PK691_13005, partial [Thermomicrobiales bacterium]|nr:hypothetical protein [Thermomicrobiales bacterium]
MAQVSTTATADGSIAGLDPSLAVPGETGELIRKWGPKLVTISALVLGAILAYTLPALKLSDGSTLNIGEVNKVLTFATPSRGWILPMSWFGGIFALLVVWLFPDSERFARTIGTTIGVIGAGIFPYFVATRQTWVDDKASGLGSGMIAALICFAVALVMPWLGLLVINRQQPVLGFGWSRWLFVGPAVLWILLLTAFPLVYAITTSRYGFRNGRIARSVGWDNYKRAFAKADWGSGFQSALTWAAIAAAIVIVLGLIFAFVSNEFSLDRQAIGAIAGFLPLLVIPSFVIGLLTNVLADPRLSGLARLPHG